MIRLAFVKEAYSCESPNYVLGRKKFSLAYLNSVQHCSFVAREEEGKKKIKLDCQPTCPHSSYGDGNLKHSSRRKKTKPKKGLS